MALRLPPVFTTLLDTQHRLLEFCGSAISHQLPSDVLPVICELCPTTNALMGIHAVPGPKRQFTFTSLGNAIGTLGVSVKVGRGVLAGNAVCVGSCVGTANVKVAEGSASGTAVDVGGAFDGKLHASIAKTSTSAGNKIRLFIASPFESIYERMIPLTRDELYSPGVELRRCVNKKSG
jgi:hypothetical protein